MDNTQLSVGQSQNIGSEERKVSKWYRDKVSWTFFALFVSSLVLQLWMAGNFQGYIGDQNTFISWMKAVVNGGIVKTYQSSNIDYPPIYPLLLGVLGHVASSLHLQVQSGQWLIKLPGIIFDAGAMIVMFLFTKSARPAWRVTVLILFCLNPAILFDTAVWGQVDILDGILSALAILLIATKRPFWSGFTFGVSLLSKFESILIAPILMVYGLKDWVLNKHPKLGVKLLAGTLVPFAVFVVWFAIQGGGFINMFRDAYVATTGEYPFLSMNAMNIWFDLFGTSPGTRDTTDVIGSIDYKVVGLFLLFVAVMYAAYYIWFSTKDATETLLKSAAIVSFSFYMLATEIHERYIIMALIFSMFTMLKDRKFIWLSLGLTFTAFWNMWTVLYSSTNTTADIWMVYLNCVVFIAMFVMTNREIINSKRLFHLLPGKAVIFRMCIAGGTLTMAVRSFILLNTHPAWYPSFRIILIVISSIAATVTLAGPKYGRRMFIVAAATALVAAMAGPLVYNMDTITISHAGSGPMSPSGFGGGRPNGGSGHNPHRNAGQGPNGGSFSPPSGTSQGNH